MVKSKIYGAKTAKHTAQVAGSIPRPGDELRHRGFGAPINIIGVSGWFQA